MTPGIYARGKARSDVNPTRILTFAIDGKPVSAHEDETILTVARQNDIFIPTLCHLDGLSERGACRLCLVQVKGQARPVPACVTLPRQDMEVITDTPELLDYRRKVLELTFSERNHVCAACVSNGHCELQDLSTGLGMTHVRYPYLYPRLEVDASHPRFVLDHNRCVLCLRCVRVCDEIEGAHTMDIMGRGLQGRIITDLNEPWGQSQTCTGCGKCVQVCPTGALAEKGRSVAEMVKRRQFLPYLTAMRHEEAP